MRPVPVPLIPLVPLVAREHYHIAEIANQSHPGAAFANASF